MTVLTTVLPWITASALVGAGGLAIRDYLRERDPTSGALAWALGLTALLAAILRVNTLLDEPSRALWSVTLVAFAGSGYALLVFASRVVALARKWRPLSLAALTVATGIALVAGVPVRTQAESAGLPQGAVLALVVLWLAIVVGAAVRIILLGRRRPPILRARLGLLGAGYLGIAGVLFGSLVTPGDAQGTAQVALQVLVLGCAGLIVVAAAPPLRLRRRWLRRAGERIAGATLPIGSWSWDAQSELVAFSDGMHSLVGTDPATFDPTVETIFGLLHPDDRESVETTVRRCVEGHRPFELDTRVVRPDGEVRWLHAAGQAVIDPVTGAVAGLFGTVHDVTDRKAVEVALRGSEERFRSFIESAPDPVVIVDEAGRIVLANDETCALLGYERDEIVGSPVERLVPEAIREAHTAHREGYVADPRRRPMGAGLDLLARKADGTEVPVDISLSPVDVDGEMLVVVVMRDVTERREVVERLRALDEMKNAFLEAVSHELRTPLTSVLGFARTMERDDFDLSPTDVRGMAARITGNAERLLELLGDLLDLDRINRGILEPNRRPTELPALVERVLGGIDLGGRPVEVDVEDATVDIAPAQAERILENLFTNVARHTPPRTPIRLRLHAYDGGAEILVEDAGPGVPDHLKGEIFRPFRRGDGRAARAVGTGVGLSLVAKFAELHGGEAWVEDRPGGGARFRVRLPARADPLVIESADGQMVRRDSAS